MMETCENLDKTEKYERNLQTPWILQALCYQDQFFARFT